MNLTKNNKLLITFLCGCFSLFGCNTNNKEQNKDKYLKPIGKGYHFKTDKNLECYFFKKDYSGGLSCNWAEYNKNKKVK